VDVFIYEGIIRISDSLYNKGLALVKNSDLTGAIECLSKSVGINKNNIRARNLLGLALFEVGHVGDALKHWVISHSLLPADNPAAKYIQSAQDSGRSLERLSDAVGMYNQSLEYIHQKSDDLAIIQLKKAIEINPKFIDALNLLALCYLIQGDQEKASRAIDKVLSMDLHNTIALNYFSELHPTRVRDPRARRPAQQNMQPNVSAQPPPASFQRIPAHDKKAVNFHIAEILSFVIGAICTFAALYVLVFPAIQRENERRVDEIQASIAANAQAYQDRIEQQQKDLEDSDQLILDLKEEITGLLTRIDVQERTNRVLNAYGMLAEGRLQEAVDMMANGVGTSGLASDVIEKALSINSTAFPKLAQQYYDEGRNAYAGNDHDKALVDFEKSFLYVDGAAPYMPNLLHYLAMLYARDENKLIQASDYLTIIMEDYDTFYRNNRNNINNLFAEVTAAMGD
jgi:tetratricopeptide (TPR) repeat protein